MHEFAMVQQTSMYQQMRQNVRLSFHKEAEVFNAAKPLHPLARTIVRILRDEPETRVNVWMTGETSSGKETSGGQLLYTLLKQATIRRLLSTADSSDPNLAIRTHSQIRSIRACKDRGLIVTPTPFHTEAEYDLADSVTGSVAQLPRIADRELRIFEVQAVYHRGKEGINLGTGAIRRTIEMNRGNQNEYNFVVMQGTRWEIQQASMKARRPIRRVATGEIAAADPNQVLLDNNVIVDQVLDADSVVDFNAGYGTDLAVYRGNPAMDSALFDASASGEIAEEVTIQDLISWNHRLFTENTEGIPPAMINAWDAAWNKRLRAQLQLYASMAEKDFGAEPENVVIFPGFFLPDTQIHLFRKLMNSYRYSDDELSAVFA